jgi:hypothetical protein
MLATLATPLLAPSFINNSGDSNLFAAEFDSVRIEFFDAGGALALVAPQVDWVLTQPYTVARSAVRTGVMAMETYDRMWLPVSLSQQPEASVSLPLPEPAAPTESPFQAVQTAANAEAAVEASGWPAKSSLQPFWWVAATVLGTAWGVIQAQKWYVTRQKQGPPQVRKSVPA